METRANEQEFLIHANDARIMMEGDLDKWIGHINELVRVAINRNERQIYVECQNVLRANKIRILLQDRGYSTHLLTEARISVSW